MLRTLLARIQQGFQTVPFPSKRIVLPERYRGLPRIDAGKCQQDCRQCISACPTNAIDWSEKGASIDLGKCLFCRDCQDACLQGSIQFSRDYRMSVRRREDLVLGAEGLQLAGELEGKIKALFGRSLKLRQVSAGGCNGCELDTNVLNTLAFDLSRFGIQFVASPRHADGILVTGPVTENMLLALKKTYDAVPAPKLVVALGACAISGGPYADHPEVRNGVGTTLPVDLFIPGCPPHPWTILDGLLRLLGRLKEKKR